MELWLFTAAASEIRESYQQWISRCLYKSKPVYPFQTESFTLTPHTHTHTQMTFSFHHPRNPFYYLQVFVAFNFLREISICSYMRSVLLSFSHRDFKAPLISGAFLYPFLKQGEASSSLPTVQPLISAQTNSKFTQLRFRLPIFISSIKLLRGDRVNKART